MGLLKSLTHLLDGELLDLADALCRDAELVGKFLQRDGLAVAFLVEIQVAGRDDAAAGEAGEAETEQHPQYWDTNPA